MLSKEISAVIRALPKPTAKERREMLTPKHFALIDDCGCYYIYSNHFVVSIGTPTLEGSVIYVENPADAAQVYEQVEQFGAQTTLELGWGAPVPEKLHVNHHLNHGAFNSSETTPMPLEPSLLAMLANYNSVLEPCVSKDFARHNLMGINLKINEPRALEGELIQRFARQGEGGEIIEGQSVSVNTTLHATDGFKLMSIGTNINHLSEEEVDINIDIALPKLLSKTLKSADQCIEFLVGERTVFATYFSNNNHLIAVHANLIIEKYPDCIDVLNKQGDISKQVQHLPALNRGLKHACSLRGKAKGEYCHIPVCHETHPPCVLVRKSRGDVVAYWWDTAEVISKYLERCRGTTMLEVFNDVIPSTEGMFTFDPKFIKPISEVYKKFLYAEARTSEPYEKRGFLTLNGENEGDYVRLIIAPAVSTTNLQGSEIRHVCV